MIKFHYENIFFVAMTFRKMLVFALSDGSYFDFKHRVTPKWGHPIA